VNLAPNLLVRKGLRFTLEKFIEDLGDVNKLQTELLYQVKTEIGAEKAIHLYRIIQEISHNTLKHAKAKKLLIHLKEKHGKLYLLCRDDGRGFNALEVNENRTGLGLGSLQSRTVMLEGKMRFKSKPKYGTEYFFEFPLSNR
jgi:signal transduction histidine kinase